MGRFPVGLHCRTMHSQDLHRLTIDGVGRIYSNGEDLWLPSVSTVLSMRPTPEGLRIWKERTDNHEEITRYKQNRGTLVHEALQQDIMPEDPRTGEPVDVLWGEDEQQSEDELKENGEYERFEEEFEWVEDTWEMIKKVANFPRDGVSDDETNTILDIETFTFNTDIGYAGQFDLLYHDIRTDETVLADFKTSKDVYEKHCLQASAYANSVPISVDRMEVIRINPDRQDWYISSSHDWPRSRDDLFDEFCKLRHQLEQEKLETIIETIQDADADQDGVMREEM